MLVKGEGMPASPYSGSGGGGGGGSGGLFSFTNRGRAKSKGALRVTVDVEFPSRLTETQLQGLEKLFDGPGWEDT